MIVCLAGVWPWREAGIYNTVIERERESLDRKIDIAILESFYYADEWTEWVIPRISHFMLDSGAFTFMQNSKKAVDWDEYLTKYIDFINRNDVELFFELDIDSIVGYNRVLDLRERLEKETGKQCIPVWHPSRGKDEFIKMCQDYSYVAIGGIVSGEIKRSEYIVFPWFIKTAHQNSAKIHALGFTNLDGMKKYHFDSVDSSAWTSGNRFGHVYQFNGETLEKFSNTKGGRMKNVQALAVNNFNEWIKFQKYAKSRL